MFRSRTRIYVASTVYNLAGAVEDRPNYLRTAMARSVLGGTGADDGMGRSIVKAYMNGPAMDKRRFYRWARENYTLGMPRAQLVNSRSVDSVDVTSEIPAPDGASVELVGVSIEAADFFFWADRHILENHPDKQDTDWTSDFDEDAEEVTIQFEDLTLETFSVPDFDVDETYAYIYYDLTQGEERERRLFIYKQGEGSELLDGLIENSVEVPEFFPFIPLRIKNRSITHSNYEEIFPKLKEVFKRSTGGENIEELLESIEDNDDIDDVDFCYLVYGVPLNTEEESSQAYIYEFLRGLIPYQNTTETEYQAWRKAREEDSAFINPSSTTIRLRGQRPSITDILKSFFTGFNASLNYDMRLTWITITEEFGIGKGKEDAKPGDYWFENLGDFEWNPNASRSFFIGRHENFALYRQRTEDSYSRLILRGLEHHNYVYGGKSVDIRMSEALDDSDESGFIIPMHYPTLKRLPIKAATQTALGSTLLVFNSYEVVRRRWYQRGIFRFVFSILVAVVLSIAMPGLGGILGSNLAVGASMGFAGTTALIVGAIANAVAAMVISVVIETVAVEIAGAKLGSIIAAISMFMVFQFAANFHATGSMAINWGDMMKAENLLQLTNSVAQAATRTAHEIIQDIQDDLSDMADDFSEKMDDIEKRTQEILGYSGVVLDPLMLFEMQENSELKAESRDTFISRTLLTGSDIAEVSNNMIGDFPRITLELPDYTI